MIFKVGDRVRRTGYTFGEISPGDERTVARTHKSYRGEPATIGFLNDPTRYSVEFFELVRLAESPAPGKPTPDNPKKLYGDKKPPVHLIHPIAELHESAALHSGAVKYGMNNYIETPVEALTYVGAIKRHLSQWLSGERVDAKELVHHLGAIKACCTILLTAEATGTLIDNRPGAFEVPPLKACDRDTYASATAAAFAEVEGIVAHLNALYPAKSAT